MLRRIRVKQTNMKKVTAALYNGNIKITDLLLIKYLPQLINLFNYTPLTERIIIEFQYAKENQRWTRENSSMNEKNTVFWLCTRTT